MNNQSYREMLVILKKLVVFYPENIPEFIAFHMLNEMELNRNAIEFLHNRGKCTEMVKFNFLFLVRFV